MGKYKICYPGVYTPEEQAVLEVYRAEKDALNNRGEVSIDDLIHGRLPKDTPGVGRADEINERKLKSNYLQSDPTNPLYFDKDYAKNSPYGDVIAFPVMVAHDGAFFDAMPYQLRDTLTISGLTHDFDILLPVYEGDTLYYITDEQTFTDITPAEGSEFRTFDITGRGRVFNQKGELVCAGRSRVKESLRILSEGSTTPRMVDQDCPDWWSMNPVAYMTDADWAVVKDYWSKETRRGAEPLYWEDVNVGDMPIPTVDGPFKAIQVGGGGPPMPMPEDGELPPMPEGEMPPMPEGEGPHGGHGGPNGDPAEAQRSGFGGEKDEQGSERSFDPEGRNGEERTLRGRDSRTVRLQMEDPETFAKMVRSDYDGCWYLPGDGPSPEKKRSIIMNFHARDAAVRMMTNWCGDHGWIKNIKWRIMRKTPGYDTPEYPDNPDSFIKDVPYTADPRIANWYEHQQHGLEYSFLLSKGYITRKWEENGEHLVEMQWWVSLLFGKVYEEGATIFRLPSRND